MSLCLFVIFVCVCECYGDNCRVQTTKADTAVSISSAYLICNHLNRYLRIFTVGVVIYQALSICSFHLMFKILTSLNQQSIIALVCLNFHPVDVSVGHFGSRFTVNKYCSKLLKTEKNQRQPRRELLARKKKLLTDRGCIISGFPSGAHTSFVSIHMWPRQ